MFTIISSLNCSLPILKTPAIVEERFEKLSLGADGKSNEDLTHIVLATVYYPKLGKTERVKIRPTVAGY